MEVEIKDHRFTAVYNYIMNKANNFEGELDDLKATFLIEGFNISDGMIYDAELKGNVNITQRSSKKIGGGVVNVYQIQISEMFINENGRICAMHVNIDEEKLQELSTMIRLKKIKAITKK